MQSSYSWATSSYSWASLARLCVIANNTSSACYTRLLTVLYCRVPRSSTLRPDLNGLDISQHLCHRHSTFATTTSSRSDAAEKMVLGIFEVGLVGLVWFGLFILDTIRVTPQRASQASKAQPESTPITNYLHVSSSSVDLPAPYSRSTTLGRSPPLLIRQDPKDPTNTETTLDIENRKGGGLSA